MRVRGVALIQALPGLSTTSRAVPARPTTATVQ